MMILVLYDKKYDKVNQMLRICSNPVCNYTPAFGENQKHCKN